MGVCQSSNLVGPAPKFGFEGLDTTAYVTRVIDGDTIDVNFMFRGVLNMFRIRMEGYDSPEMHPKKKGRAEESLKAEVVEANAAKKFLADLIEGKKVRLVSSGQGKFGRILGTVHYRKQNVNQLMVNKGHGVPYNGGTKKQFQPKKVTTGTTVKFE